MDRRNRSPEKLSGASREATRGSAASEGLRPGWHECVCFAAVRRAHSPMGALGVCEERKDLLQP